MNCHSTNLKNISDILLVFRIIHVHLLEVQVPVHGPSQSLPGASNCLPDLSSLSGVHYNSFEAVLMSTLEIFLLLLIIVGLLDLFIVGINFTSEYEYIIRFNDSIRKCYRLIRLCTYIRRWSCISIQPVSHINTIPRIFLQLTQLNVIWKV